MCRKQRRRCTRKKRIGTKRRKKVQRLKPKELHREKNGDVEQKLQPYGLSEKGLCRKKTSGREAMEGDLPEGENVVLFIAKRKIRETRGGLRTECSEESHIRVQNQETGESGPQSTTFSPEIGGLQGAREDEGNFVRERQT